MRVLVACEYSGRVRDAFTDMGHDAVSCDLLPTESKGAHYQGDVRDILGDGWDLLIAHPPCTDLASSGAAWFQKKGPQRREEALDFVRTLMGAPIQRICVENPVGIISRYIRPPDQIIQPFWFGDGWSKRTCLWLKGLPPLVPTHPVKPQYVTNPDGSTYRDAKGKRYPVWHYSTGAFDGKIRSLTPQGIANAMAAQWSEPQLYCFDIADTDDLEVSYD